MIWGEKVSNPKVAFYTLGCKVNQNETEALGALFRDHGYEIVEFTDVADIYVINTCTVTHLGDRKSRQIIRRAIKTNPNALMVVTGCYAQASPEEVEKIPGVDLIIGTSDRARMIEIIEEHRKGQKPVTYVQDIMQAKDFEELPVDKLINRTRAYLKVQEGCEQFCSYCIIPYTRGPLRSRDIDNTIKEANRLVDAGFQEIILTGIHLGAFGEEKGLSSKNLAYLCQELLEKTKVKRLRIGSIEPTEVTEQLINLMSENPRFCRHLHIPLQNGDDQILKLMNRPYDTQRYRQIIQSIREKVPGIGITTDIMVGFPGEEESNFKNSLAFVKEMEFSGLHVFKYSPRKGTPAASFANQVAPDIKEERSKAMQDLGKLGFQNFAQKFIGQVYEVLVETPWPQGGWEGHTDNYLRVVFKGESEKGTMAKVLLKKVKDNYILGQLV